MNKYKFFIKGKGEEFQVYFKGDIISIMSSIMQFICEVSINNDITKKQFLEQCKHSYEIVMKNMNEEGRD